MMNIPDAALGSHRREVLAGFKERRGTVVDYGIPIGDR